MKAVIRISTRIRSCAPIPRDFGNINGLEHLGLIYQQKIITTPEEFNEVLARVSDSRFPNRGCAFFPYLLTAEDEAKMTEAPTPVVVAPEPETITPDQTGEYVVSIDAPASFTLDGKSIMLNGERIAGLFGDEKQLRVVSAHSDLRPQIEAWLQTITPEPSDQ